MNCLRISLIGIVCITVILIMSYMTMHTYNFMFSIYPKNICDFISSNQYVNILHIEIIDALVSGIVTYLCINIRIDQIIIQKYFYNILILKNTIIFKLTYYFCKNKLLKEYFSTKFRKNMFKYIPLIDNETNKIIEDLNNLEFEKQINFLINENQIYRFSYLVNKYIKQHLNNNEIYNVIDDLTIWTYSINSFSLKMEYFDFLDKIYKNSENKFCIGACLYCKDSLTNTNHIVQCKNCGKLIHDECFFNWIHDKPNFGLDGELIVNVFSQYPCVHCMQQFDNNYLNNDDILTHQQMIDLYNTNHPEPEINIDELVANEE